ncbi:uncharacterized protein ColSpa_02987 [Colletotrichum spaethianum]|uniref:Heme haloperoxidase family profile domain-containing protein n=1 Tax=Colletotrichum spaethianum TaxID=700344 RepID=A0AA37L694_9PEZI|nr:uncharacterized protein ColSpa_02987 [Colletotrichum spaethianum]GKT42806.1 hypothetical protein ColSpa_02987 [Colletotrichum spaethianum]
MLAFNFSRTVAAAPVPAALEYATTGVNGTFHLDDLARKPLDHNGSLNKGDLAQGDNLRLEDARRANPAFELDAARVAATFGQTSGVLTAFGGSVQDGKARKNWINASFGEDRLPWALGWKTSENMLEAADLGPMAKALREYAPEGV